MLLSATVFIYFKEYNDKEQSFTYTSEKLVETIGTAVNLMECMMAEVAHFNLVEQHTADDIKNSIDFERIRNTGGSIHHQRIVNGIMTGFTRIYISWWCK
jgi:hypothetical protein